MESMNFQHNFFSLKRQTYTFIFLIFDLMLNCMFILFVKTPYFYFFCQFLGTMTAAKTLSAESNGFPA